MAEFDLCIFKDRRLHVQKLPFNKKMQFPTDRPIYVSLHCQFQVSHTATIGGSGTVHCHVIIHLSSVCFRFICILSYCFLYVFIFMYPVCLFTEIMIFVSVCYHIFAPLLSFICALAMIEDEDLPSMIFRDLNKG